MRALAPLLVWCLGFALERTLAFTLVRADAAGQLLSAGEHSSALTIVSVPLFLLLRLGVSLALCPTLLVTLARVRGANFAGSVDRRGERAQEAPEERA